MSKKIVAFGLALVMLLGTTAYAAEPLGEASKIDTPIPAALSSSSTDNVTPEEYQEAAQNGLIILEKITDQQKIQQLVDDGEVELSRNGELPLSVFTYLAPDESEHDLSAGSDQPSAAAYTSGITVTKTRYYDGQYFDDYERYEIDGPAEYTKTYSRTDTRSWNASLSGSITVGGKVYKVADVKAAVEGTVGYTMGSTKTSTDSYKINIPAGKYWVIKVWTSFLVYQYDAKVGATTISTGYTWKPNGLIIRHTEYNA